MKKGNLIVGLLLILFGIILGASILTESTFEFWPAFVLIPGLVFETSFFASKNKKNAGLLVPGGILTVIGILFFFEEYTNWQYSEYTWPIYILAVAVGLFQLYIFGNRDNGLLIPVSILTGLSVIFFIQLFFEGLAVWDYVLPGIIIIIGFVIIITGKRSKRPKNIEYVKTDEDEEEEETFIEVDDEEEIEIDDEEKDS